MSDIIRKASVLDVDKIKKIATESWHHTYEGIIPIEIQKKFLNEFYSEEFLIKRINKSDFSVVLYEDHIVGFINFFKNHESKTALLTALYLLPQFQNQGLGTLLFNEYLKEYKEDIREINVEVEKENIPAINFYKKNNFVIDKEYTDDFFDFPLKTIKMKLSI
ncbi:GNAT family N-acetyltransferase [Macrococcoides caseolyticum]|uniref:GNAT family N-acetyltransferase n=1 Tax=Macrococcoides caseolyticum TaxID=69966 RepID=UPI000C31C65D|nr:GNAT family N-acetyltransferase [Macrococcus caseolyticus]HEE9186279.1 GNAT family N-acetyltransferase [Staphylococcus aureus]PKE48476.1 GNAT family N-acetyltransferase [Macrococcus caseolyticus]PKE64463.1 GNAT family N-acetyltransferase [Macrococcus caseolyticus]PKE71423.1 GNAT family N-acetyltransferase [Macrococcus caseolyticus]PKF20369.1 GNAT family N-acetyltransferase [Macrococcus caseolyticus]